MTTFTFISTCDRKFGDEPRVLAFRGDLAAQPSLRHFDRYMRMHPNRCIDAMYQVEKPTLAEARQWLDYVLYE